MSSSLFGGGERPPSPPHTVKSPSSHDATPSPEAARAAPGPERPCTLHAACRPTQVDIDRRGDLILIVGDDACGLQEAYELGDSADAKQREEAEKSGQLALLGQLEQPVPPDDLVSKSVAFRVCSRSMARATPPFDTMLYGRFAEARKPHSGWTVRLPDDDPQVMRVLLPAIHGRFDEFDAFLRRIKGAEGLRALYKITVVTDKYDLAHILRPWAAHLARNLEDTVESLHGIDLDRALWVSWDLGLRSMFSLVAQKLAWNKTKSDFLLPLPPGAMKSILDLRIEAIHALLRPIKDTIELSTALKDLPNHAFRCEASTSPRSVCNAAILGSLIQSLYGMGFWPLLSADDWEGTVEEFQGILYTHLRIQISDGHRGLGCYKPMRQDGRVSWCPTTTLGLTKYQDDHLALRAEKLGLTDGNM